MNKKIIIPIAAVILIILGASLFLLTKSSSKPSISNQEKTAGQNTVPSQSTTSNKTETIQGTLKSLLTANKSIKCTFLSKTKTSTTEGTVYASGGKARSDFKSTTDKITMTGHTITDKEFSYFWTDSSKQGMKIPFNQPTPKTTPSTSTGSAEYQTSDINQNYTYSCQDWTENPAQFILPSDITFSTFAIPSITIPSGTATSPKAGSEDTSSACSACDNLPEGQTKDACKTQLNCK